MGYRATILISLLLYLIGNILLSSNISLLTASIAQYFIGLGILPIVRLGIPIINESTEKGLAEKFVGTLMIGTTMRGIFCAITFNWLKNWQHVILFFCTIPSLILLFATFFILEDTPKYLLKMKD